MLFWQRYIDDIFLVYGGEQEQFDSYLADINKIHPTIKFTAECNSDQATFLDVTAYKGERFKETGVLDVKTYIKPTNKQLYVHATSYHPKGTGKGIVIGEALRYLRTNSDEANFRQCIANHKKVLKSRGYKPTTTNKLLEPITFGMRETALAPNPKRFKQKGDDAAKTMTYTPNSVVSLSGGSVTKINGGAKSASSVGKCEGGEPPLTFVTTFNDVTPQVRKVVKDLWPMLHGDAVLGNLFPKPPILALKRNPTIANRVVKSKPIPISATAAEIQSGQNTGKNKTKTRWDTVHLASQMNPLAKVNQPAIQLSPNSNLSLETTKTITTTEGEMVKKMKWPVPANLSLTRQSLGSIGKNRNPTKNPEGGVLGQETAKKNATQRACAWGREVLKMLTQRACAWGREVLKMLTQRA